MSIQFIELTNWEEVLPYSRSYYNIPPPNLLTLLIGLTNWEESSKCVNFEEDNYGWSTPVHFHTGPKTPPPTSLLEEERCRRRCLRTSSQESTRTAHFVRSLVRSTSSSYLLLPVDLTPSPPSLRLERLKRSAPRSRRSVFGRFRQKGENGLKHLRPRRCLPRGSVFRACFLALFFFKIKFILF